MILSRMAILRDARSVTIAAALTGAIALCTNAAFGQSYPTNVVRIVVPFPPGGPIDFVARALADKLSASLKQPFIVDNRPGAAGNIGAEAVAKAAPDGHTLLLVLDSTLTVNSTLYKKLPFDSERDFTPISVIVSYAQMLVVHPSVPVNSVAEFVAFAKNQHRRPVAYATGGGNGSPAHLTMEYFRAEADFPALQVPYKGFAPAVMDLIAGQVSSGFLPTPGVLPHVKDGKLKALAVSGTQRSALAPEVPTIAEAGYPGFNTGFYFVMLAPAGLPQSIRALLEREIQQVLKSPDLVAKLRAQDLEPVGSTSAEAKARLKADAERWTKIITAAHITAD